MSFYLYNSQELLLELITPEIAELVGMRARKYVVDGFRQTPSNWLQSHGAVAREYFAGRQFEFTNSFLQGAIYQFE